MASINEINVNTEENILDALAHNILIEILTYLDSSHFSGEYDEEYLNMLEDNLKQILKHKNYKNQTSIRNRILGLYDENFIF